MGPVGRTDLFRTFLFGWFLPVLSGSPSVGGAQAQDTVLLPIHPEEPRGCSRVRTARLGLSVQVQVTLNQRDPDHWTVGSVTEPIRSRDVLFCSEVRLEEDEMVLILRFFKLDPILNIVSATV